ncbi:unnamed protein product, partial [Rotaria sp. Silwood2]
MSKSLPTNILNYCDDDFYELVKQKCGSDVVEFLKVLNISSVQSLLGVNNLFEWLEFNSEKLRIIKNKLAFQHDNGFIEVRWGVRTSLERFIRDLRAVSDGDQDVTEQVVSQTDRMTLSSDFLQKHPVLKSLINLYQTIDSQNHENDLENPSFLTSLLDNISNNLCRSKNAYRYNDYVLRFAVSLYVQGGKNAYEFVRLNIPGALPSISTLQRLAINTELRITEADFRFDSLATHMNTVETNISFASEDCTAVVKKISYDNATNSFIGFTTPLKNGLPIPLHYQTESFEQLRDWFLNKDCSPLLNIHMIQPITITDMSSNPFLLSAYGTDSEYKSIDIIRRWTWIFEQTMLKNIRIVGYSTDGDPKYLRAMRLATGFFASLSNIKLNSHNDAFHIKIPKNWSWYFLYDRQLFLCFQDATHLCTKLRNRLLSSTANMLIGNRHISLDCLSTLINKFSKLHHNLVKSDIFPKDRQNFNSCIKICSDDVIKCLLNIPNTEGMIIYLRLLRSIMIAYIDKETVFIDRLYHAWFSVFLSRWWRSWLEIPRSFNTPTRLSQDNIYAALRTIDLAGLGENTYEYGIRSTLMKQQSSSSNPYGSPSIPYASPSNPYASPSIPYASPSWNRS